MDEGYIYALWSPTNRPNLYKIGQTTRTPEERAIELSAVTGVGQPYQVHYWLKVTDCEQAENLIHKRLRKFRDAPNREFFELSLPSIVQVFLECGEQVGVIQTPSELDEAVIQAEKGSDSSVAADYFKLDNLIITSSASSNNISIQAGDIHFICTDAKLFPYKKFRNLAATKGIKLRKSVTDAEWENIVSDNAIMVSDDKVSGDIIPAESDVSAQFVTLVNEFCSDALLSASKRDDLFLGRVWAEPHPDNKLDEMCVYFRLKDLQEFLARKHFSGRTKSQITSRLERLMSAKRHKFHLRRTTVNVWYIPEPRRVSS